MLRAMWIFALGGITLAACDGGQGIEDTTPDTTDDNNDTENNNGVSEDLAGDTIEEALAVEWEENADSGNRFFEIEELINSNGDRDFYSIPMNAGDAIFVGAYSYGLNQLSEPDTVLRLYSPSGELMYTNDDMPYRLLETDSSLFFEALETGSYVIEVLEWGDWDAELNPDGDSSGSGGDNYEYLLQGFPVFVYQPPDESTNDDPLTMLEYTADPDNFAYVTDPVLNEETTFRGDMIVADDVDYYPITVDPDDGTSSQPYSALFYTVGFWGQPLYFEPEITILQLNAGEERIIAQSQDVLYSVDRRQFYNYIPFFNDPGIIARLEPGDYYLKVRDTAGNFGMGTFHAGIMRGYFDSLAPSPIGDTIEMEAFTSGIGSGGRVFGNLSEAAPTRTWIIEDPDGASLDGKYLNFFVMAEQFGSLADTMATLYQSDGTTMIGDPVTSNTYDNGPDPEAVDIQLQGVGDRILIEVEAESLSTEEFANNYILYVTISDEPLQ